MGTGEGLGFASDGADLVEFSVVETGAVEDHGARGVSYAGFKGVVPERLRKVEI